MVQITENKYVICILLDISRAFDSGWWPLILFKLKVVECSVEQFNIINVIFKIEQQCYRWTVCLSKVHKRGCSQGYVLGPVLWNVLFEDSPIINYVNNVTYGDDVVLLTLGGSRRTSLKGNAKI